MSALHSIWLMPSPESEAALQVIIQDLAGRFASPLFQPHLTFMEEQERKLPELASVCRTLAAGTEEFCAPIRVVASNDLYFRSLYALFQAEGTLMNLRRSMVEALCLESPGAFMPHISLLYGVEPGVQKERARAALELDLAGTWIWFDRICVVASAKTIPVADWAVKFTAGFSPAPARLRSSGGPASRNA
jgi:hypothetical protein